MVTEQDILRYLEGRSSAVESDQIQSWLAQDEANVDYFNSIKTVLSASSSIKDYQTTDVEAEWNEFNNLITSEEQNELVENPKAVVNKERKFNFFPYSIAASLAILIGAFFYIQNQSTPVAEDPLIVNSLILVESQESTKTFILPDSTTVQLDTFSILEYVSTFELDSIRQVSLLAGSAVFDVAHDMGKKFVVSCDGLGIEVLGTKFKLGKSNGQVKINLKSGSIKAYQISNKDNSITMKPGDEFSFSGQTFIDTKKPVNKIDLAAEQMEPPAAKEESIEEDGPKGSVYRIRDVLDFLDKKYGKQLKIERKLGVNKDDKIRIDINQDNLSMILDDLEKATSLNTKPGKCDDCYIITAGSKK